MKNFLSVLLVVVFTCSVGASAFATEAAGMKEKLEVESSSSQHKVMDKIHKNHKADKAIKATKSAPSH